MAAVNLKFWQWFYDGAMRPNDADGVTNSVDSETGAV